MRRLALVIAISVLLGSCFASSERTETGAGFPQIAVDFPATSEPGSVQPMTLRVTNPGPQPMGSVVVTFTRVGTDPPIVDAAAQGENPAIVSIDPEPVTVDPAAVIYRFEGLGEGETATITFELKVPSVRGVAANSVQVSDGQNPTRLRGVRLETDVQV